MWSTFVVHQPESVCNQCDKRNGIDKVSHQNIGAVHNKYMYLVYLHVWVNK